MLYYTIANAVLNVWNGSNLTLTHTIHPMTHSCLYLHASLCEDAAFTYDMFRGAGRLQRQLQRGSRVIR